MTPQKVKAISVICFLTVLSAFLVCIIVHIAKQESLSHQRLIDNFNILRNHVQEQRELNAKKELLHEIRANAVRDGMAHWETDVDGNPVWVWDGTNNISENTP